PAFALSGTLICLDSPQRVVENQSGTAGLWGSSSPNNLAVVVVCGIGCGIGYGRACHRATPLGVAHLHQSGHSPGRAAAPRIAELADSRTAAWHQESTGKHNARACIAQGLGLGFSPRLPTTSEVQMTLKMETREMN